MMKGLLLVFIATLLIVACKPSAEKILKDERFFNFYISYKKELFKKRKPEKVDVDSIRDFHKVTQEEMETVEAAVRKTPSIWYQFNKDVLHYLDSSINIEDSIRKFKTDSVKMTKFRYREPEKWKQSQALGRKNRALMRERKKRLEAAEKKKGKKKKKKTPPTRYKGKTRSNIDKFKGRSSEKSNSGTRL